MYCYKVGLVQNIGKTHVKDSIDRIIGFLPNDCEEPKLLLCKMKARVASTTA